MSVLERLIEHYGLVVVFANVLAEQLGAPLPAYPALILTAAWMTRSGQPLWPIFALALAATLLADSAWYVAGKHIGPRVLRTLCRISLSPDSCVSNTRRLYGRWGAPSLLVAKFIPGFASIATAMAGETRTRYASFLVFDTLGAALWAGVAVLLGRIFSGAVDQLLATLAGLGHLGLILVLAALALYLARKAWLRQRFLREIRMDRIGVDELAAQIERGEAPVILDVRPPIHREREGWIPGALAISDVSEVDADPQRDLVIYCACPNEASAARLAQQLKARGYRRARPLAGGIDAWVAAGHPLAQTQAPGGAAAA